MTWGVTTAYQRYMSRHRIKPNTAHRVTGPVLVCAVDTIRIHANLGNGAKWRHDPEEVRQAASRHNWAERKDLI